MRDRFEKATFVLLSFSRVEDPYSSVSLMLAKEIAKKQPVYFINTPYTVFDYVKNRKNPDFANRWKHGKDKYSIRQPFAKLPLFKEVSTPLLTSINWLPPSGIYRFLQQRNSLKLERMLSDLLHLEGIEDYIFFNSTAPVYYPIIPKEHPPLVSIYQSVDDISQAEYLSKHAAEAEKQWMQLADINLVTSKGLKELRNGVSKNIFVLPNAGDFTLFNKALNPHPKPSEIESISGKIIGFIGNLDERRIDYKLLKKLAIDHSDKHLVFIGPYNEAAVQQAGLSQCANVHLLGSRPMEILPGFLHYFDCAIIPFLKNKLTRGIYPLKINEYLAAGRQVVSTNFSQDIADFRDYIFLAETQEAFSKAIDEAILCNTPENQAKQALVAQGNSYEDRVEQLFDILEAQTKIIETNKI